MNRILVVRAGALGDTIMATSISHSLKKCYPKAKVDFLATKGMEPLFTLTPWVDTVYCLGFRKVPWSIDPWKRYVLSKLNRSRYDLAILLETHASLVRFFSKIKATAQVSITSDTCAGHAINTTHTVIRYHKLLWQAGIIPQEVTSPQLRVSTKDTQRAAKLLRALAIDCTRPIVAMHPSNSFRQRKPIRRWLMPHDRRSWPEHNWCSLILALARRYPAAQYVLIGTTWDRQLNTRILEQTTRLNPHMRIVNMAGMTDIPLAAALIEHCDALISTDSGPIHIAAAVGTPIVGLYGPTRYAETRPFCDRAKAVILKKDLLCQPCYGSPLQKECKDAVCMRSITVSDVLGAIAHLGILEADVVRAERARNIAANEVTGPPQARMQNDPGSETSPVAV